MNLSGRAKWLIAAAALTAGYVVFGPRESEPVETARAASRQGAANGSRAAQAAERPPPVARTLLMLAHRVVDQSAAGALFASHSWYVAPPPPPPPPAASGPVEPPKPVAPPLPFTYIGSYAPKGVKPVFFLTQGDRVYDVHVGDTLENTYSVDSFGNGVLVFTYKPLNQQQQLITGAAP